MRSPGGGSAPPPRLLFAVVALAALAAAPVPDLERSVVERVNEVRQARDRMPLASDAALGALAREHSCRMAREREFGHDTGGAFGERVRAAGIAYRAIGENLARIGAGADPVERAVSGWMKSEGHRDNILSPEFTRTGVGVCRRDDGAYYFTQLFVRPP